MRPGAEVEVTVDRLGEKGAGVARAAGREIRITRGVPGDRLRVRIVRRARRHLEAEIAEILEPSPLRVDPRCAHFADCGGCRWQHVLYAAQLDAKREAVEAAFAASGVALAQPVPQVIPAPDLYFYRNKMEFSFGARRWLTAAEIATGVPVRRDFALGLHVAARFDRVLDVGECHLQSELSARIVNGVRRLALDRGWTAWDTARHDGWLRHLSIRQSARLPDLMVGLVTSARDPERMRDVAGFLMAEFPEVTTLFNTVNRGVAQVATGEETHVEFGPGGIRDRVGDLTLEIGPHSFFQTNTVQAERLYDSARAQAAIGAADLVFDLYCGLGSIALYVAPAARRVVGFELDAAAVAAAERNAAANGRTNVEFRAGDVAETFARAAAGSLGVPDVVIVDPPRAGMHPRVVERLGEAAPRRIVYVSCNPATLARDVAALSSRYAVAAVLPIDLFPHTEHVECAVRLDRS